MQPNVTESNTPAAPAGGQPHPTEHAHPKAALYVQIAVILAIITGVEVWVWYQPSLRSVIVPVLLVLSAVKFTLVVSFYMHLRYDSKLFTAVFSGPLLLAFAVLIALVSLFHRVLLGV
jgi:cytochrome c oxidase subunit 4